MQYFKISTGKFIEYDKTNNFARIIIKADLLAQKASLEERIAQADPNMPTTNEQWREWAKNHYPYVSHQAEIDELAKVNAIIDAIKNLNGG